MHSAMPSDPLPPISTPYHPCSPAFWPTTSSNFMASLAAPAMATTLSWSTCSGVSTPSISRFCSLASAWQCGGERGAVVKGRWLGAAAREAYYRLHERSVSHVKALVPAPALPTCKVGVLLAQREAVVGHRHAQQVAWREGWKNGALMRAGSNGIAARMLAAACIITEAPCVRSTHKQPASSACSAPVRKWAASCRTTRSL